ncbi:hypothetical protein Poli38472_005835 [Pythium oligandrum]|uniref:Uncharacterized protein n=1 Tax=Pythium oligandrum TaxID=41045 RepID=A0A8K1CT96_PYTOL|nr:hypothetical protein Poli38472_005835 [Pythium oligandrum]|eukprot:TMW68367.1 hypothetical protein Poli38472_005835 [Pythium oligandrum]
MQPSPSISMESLLRMDLATLQSDVVLHYTQKVARLVPARTISTDKLQLLFVLSQKLLTWFLSERHELERLNRHLEKELVNALSSSSTSSRDEAGSLQVCVNDQYSQTDDGVPHEHQCIQTEQVPSEHQCTQTELVPSEHQCIQTEAAPREHVCVQTDLVPSEHQFVQTERVSHEHQCIQTDQASDKYQIVQKDEEMQIGVCGDTADEADAPCNPPGNKRVKHHHDRASIPEANYEATPHDTASLAKSQPFRTAESTIETYYRVHSAIIRLQRCIRGHVVRI